MKNSKKVNKPVLMISGIIVLCIVIFLGMSSCHTAVPISETSDIASSANLSTDSPVITLKKSKVEITVGDKYDASENIKSVKDGNGEDIKKVDSKPTEEGTAYYLIDTSKLDTSKAGEYKVTVSATLISGATTSKDFTVTVKDANSTTDKKSTGNTKSSENKKNTNSTNSANGTKSADSTKNTSKKTNSSSTKSTDGTNSANSTSNTTKTDTTQNNSSNSNNTTNSGSATQQTCKEVDNGYWENYVTKDAWDETVVDQEAWDEQIGSNDYAYVCNCGANFGHDENALTEHQLENDHGRSHIEYTYAQTVHHDAVTHTVHHDAEYGQRWVSKIETVCS